MTLVLLVIGVVSLLLLRVPIAISMLAPCLVYVAWSPDVTLGVALQRVMAGLNSFPLLAVPLFMMTGFLANAVGLADRLFRILLVLFRRVPGSLGYVNLTGGLVFSWMSGAAIADAAGLGTVMYPAMKKNGYHPGFALGLTGASSLIGPIMPPSIPAIIYAVTAGVSAGAMFLAGVVPALVMTGVLAVNVLVYVRRYPPSSESADIDIPDWKEVFTALPILAVPVIVIGGILGGVFTPTEAAVAAVMAVIALGLCYRTLTWQKLLGVLHDTAMTTGTIMFIVASASLLAWVLAREQGPQTVAELLTGLTNERWVFLLLLNVLLLLIGTMLEPVAALLITVPILLPVAKQFDIDPTHLGTIMILNLVIGLITPPVGLVAFVLSSVTGVPVGRVFRGMVPFLIPLIIVLLLVTYIPGLSLWLPDLFR